MPITRLRKRRYTTLLVSVFVLFLIYPFVAGGRFGGLLLDGFLTIVSINAILSVGDTKGRLRVALILGLPTLAARWVAAHQLHNRDADVVAYVMLAGFFSYVTFRILRHVLADQLVDFETVAGALCAYLFIGFTWASIYATLERVQPGSLSFTSEQLVSLLPSCIYYSFVTITTLGYGDVTPSRMPAEYLSFVEAVTGQLFLAVLVARLVGLQIANSLRGPAGRQ